MDKSTAMSADLATSPTEGTTAAFLTATDLHELTLEQLKEVFIDLFAKSLFLAEESGSGSNDCQTLTVTNPAFTEKNAMVEYLLSTFDMTESDLSSNLLNVVATQRRKRKWQERMTSQIPSNFSLILLRLLSPASIRNLYTTRGLGEVLKNNTSKSKSYKFYDSASRVVEWVAVVKKLQSVRLVDVDRATSQNLAELYHTLKNAEDSIGVSSNGSVNSTSATYGDLSLLPTRVLQDLCVLRGMGNWSNDQYRFVYKYNGSNTYDQDTVVARLLATDLTKGELKQYIRNLMNRLFPSPSHTLDIKLEKWNERLSNSEEFSDFHLQFLPRAFIAKMYIAKSLGEFISATNGEYKFSDQDSNVVGYEEAKEKLSTVVNRGDILTDGFYRHIYHEIQRSLLRAINSYAGCKKPESALSCKFELLELPSCILKDLCSIRYEYLAYEDIRKCLLKSKLDEEALADILLLTFITKGDLLMYIRNAMDKLKPFIGG